MRKKFLDQSLYEDQHQKLRGSILGRDGSSIQVWWKSGGSRFCVILVTNQQTHDMSQNKTLLAEAMNICKVNIHKTGDLREFTYFDTVEEHILHNHIHVIK